MKSLVGTVRYLTSAAALLSLSLGCSKLAEDCERTLTCGSTSDAGGVAPANTDNGGGGTTGGNELDTLGGGLGGSRGQDAGQQPIAATPQLGATCGIAGRRACTAAAQRDTLVCQGGFWSEADPCPEGENCESASGECRAIVTGCAGKLGGARYCADNVVRECGVDLVTDSAIETCVVGCVQGDAEGARCTKVLQVSAGSSHTCAVLDTGALRCWGDNSTGQLGNAGTDPIGDDELPSSVPVIAVAGKVTQVAAGGHHTCALLEDGSLRCWGENSSGQLGYGNTSDVLRLRDAAVAPPVEVGGKVVQLTAGEDFTCAVLQGGSVRCWGANICGKLGYSRTDTIGDDETPASIDPVVLGGPAAQVDAGANHVCAVLADGVVRCWGCGGPLGIADGSYSTAIGDDEFPARVSVVTGGAVTQVGAGVRHSCALLADDSVRCWGTDYLGELGAGQRRDIGITETPASQPVVSLGGAVLQLAVGSLHSCVVLSGGLLRCWGDNFYGQLGRGPIDGYESTTVPSAVPPVDVGGTVVQVSAGDGSTCALLDTGAIRCWGRNDFGQLGYGHTDRIGDDEVPSAAGDVRLF